MHVTLVWICCDIYLQHHGDALNAYAILMLYLPGFTCDSSSSDDVHDTMGLPDCSGVVSSKHNWPSKLLSNCVTCKGINLRLIELKCLCFLSV